jgi:hypothetical protein
MLSLGLSRACLGKRPYFPLGRLTTSSLVEQTLEEKTAFAHLLDLEPPAVARQQVGRRQLHRRTEHKQLIAESVGQTESDDSFIG